MSLGKGSNCEVQEPWTPRPSTREAYTNLFDRVPRGYRSNLAPTPWIFRGDPNKPLLVLLVMLAAALGFCFVAF